MAPRWRLPLLALGFVSLVFGVAGGLARLSPSLAVASGAISLHGALMVSAFLGTVISLDRAAALDVAWAYAAPLAAGLGGVAIVAGSPDAGLALLVGAALLFAAGGIAVFRRQPSLETALLLAGALAWVLGNTLARFGAAAAPWWIAFFVLTIGGERLELSRYLKRPRWAGPALGVLGVLLLAAPLEPRALGAVLLAVAAWLFAFDLARITIRQRGLPRYVAACLLSGYFWLAVGGARMLLVGVDDAALHAVFLGFVVSMVFGHAPVILPAVLHVRLPYRPVLYAPLALLHASLALRVLGATQAGAWGNAAAIVLFIATALACAIAFDARQDPRRASR